MLSCKDTSRLLSQAEDRTLGLGERLGVRLPLAICASCRHAARQLRFLRVAMRRLAEDDAPPRRD